MRRITPVFVISLLLSSTAWGDVFEDYLSKTNCGNQVRIAAHRQKRREKGLPVPPGNFKFSAKQMEAISRLNEKFWAETEKLRTDIGAPQFDPRKRTVFNGDESRKLTEWRKATAKIEATRYGPQYVKLLTPKQRKMIAKERALLTPFIRDKAMHHALKFTDRQEDEVLERLKDVAIILANARTNDQDARDEATKLATDEFIKKVLTSAQRNQYAKFRLTDEEVKNAYGESLLKSLRPAKQ